MEKQELPPGHNERSVFVLFGPQNNSPFVIKSASSSCLESWRSLSSLQTERGSQRRRQCSHWRRREQSPFLPLTSTASYCRCSPASSETHAIPPPGLRMLTFGEFCVHLPLPTPGSFTQLGAAIGVQPTFSASSLARTHSS